MTPTSAGRRGIKTFGSSAGPGVGETPGDALFTRIGARVRDEVEPYDDIHATADYRKRLAGVLAARALTQAASDSNGAVAA